MFEEMVPYKHRKKRRKKNERLEKRMLFSEAIDYLLQQSLELRTTNPTLSKEYIQSARKMGMRGRFHLPKPYRLFFCHFCLTPIHSNSTKVRLNSKKKQIHYQCLECGHEHRFGFSRKKIRRD